MLKQTFWAPMDGLALTITLSVAAFCMGFPVYLYSTVEVHTALLKAACVAPIFIFLFASLFAVKGYQLNDGVLLIKRTLWVTYVPLQPLESVEFRPGVMGGSKQTLGSAGLFGWLGTFRDPVLGQYRAWVTDRGKTVVLKAAGQTIMVSPLDPQKFINAVAVYKTKV